jgi:chromosome segregation ATPase
MKSAPSETAELLHRVRQQLILAQVRIMELEDARDELAPKLTDTEKLLTGAQNLADQKIAETDHLAKVLGELQTQFEHLRHMQHVTNEALNQTRREKADVTASLAIITDRATAAEQRGSQLQKEIVSLTDQLARLNASLSRVGLELAESHTTSAARLDRLNGLDAEIRTLKASRSWRWTAWLRAIERQLGGR